jgi:uncharacterized protein YdaU (DUF1376 family)
VKSEPPLAGASFSGVLRVKKMHYYKRNLGDYAKKTGRLSMLQHGAYTLLIDACYDRERFPTMEEAIDWSWASTPEEVEAVKFVISRFFVLSKDGTFVQDRILKELLDYHQKADINKRIAIEREAKRKEKSTNRAQNVNEPPPNHKPRTINQEPRTNKTITAPEGVSDQIWEDFKTLRKTLKAPITETAIKGIEREASKAGYSLEKAIEICCERGWRGFKAEWLKTPLNDSKQLSFAERDELARRRRWEESTGRTWPTDGQDEIIDITPQGFLE